MTTPIRRALRRAALAVGAALALAAAPFTATPALAAPGDAFDLPVEAFPDGSGWILTTWITINGSDPIRVALDTGTSELLLNPDAVRNPVTAPTVPQPSVPFTMLYDGTGAHGEVAQGTLSVVDRSTGAVVASTPDEVNYVSGLSCIEPGGCPHWGGVIDGVWGIGPQVAIAGREQGTPYPVYSPITQFGEPASSGLTIDYTSDVPLVRVGPVAAAPGDVLVQRGTVGEPKPNGQPQWADPELCWTISSGMNVGAGCLVSRIDSGQAIGEVSGLQFDGVVTPQTNPPENGSGKVRIGMVASGALVSWSVRGQSQPFAGVLAQEGAPNFWGQYLTGEGAVETNFNTGQNFYRLHAVKYDNVSGATYISPTAGVPGVPRMTAVTASAGEVTAVWAPGDDGAAPVDSWAVTVSDPAGAVVHRALVAAPATTTTVPGLEPDVVYTVTVAGVNSRGLGATSAPLAAEFALPATGGTVVPWGFGAVAIALGASALLVSRRRRRPALTGAL